MIWQYMLIHLPPSPYMPLGAAKDAEARTAIDVLNEWGAQGWEVVAFKAEYEVLLKKSVLPPQNAVIEVPYAD